MNITEFTHIMNISCVDTKLEKVLTWSERHKIIEGMAWSVFALCPYLGTYRTISRGL